MSKDNNFKVFYGSSNKYAFGDDNSCKGDKQLNKMENNEKKHKNSIPDINILKVMSYNIWFSNILQNERLISLIENIKYHDPHVLCLQEVTNVVFDNLVDGLHEYPYHYPKKLKQQYGCVIFSKHPIIKSEEIQYKNTQMGRSLVICHINVTVYNNIDNYSEGNPMSITSKEVNVSPSIKEIVIATSHYESIFKNFNSVKIEQFNKTKDILEDINDYHDNIILCADTNIVKTEEKYFITNDNKWKDSWIEDGEKEDNKNTYDSYKNENLMNRLIGNYTSRIDRIIYINSKLLVQEDFKLITACYGTIEPSDHFGIMTTFSIAVGVKL
jgi:endonuclease/exonuclease/phosphatase family metal-dependent hydrolase